LQLSVWQGIRDNLDIKTIKFLGLSDYVLVNFKHNDQQINFYAAYYQTQKHGAVPHSPKLCIPGDGWQIQDITTVTYNGMNFNRVLIQKRQQKQLVYYWYKQRDKTIANEYYLKWNTFIGVLKNKRTDGALVRLTTNLSANETFEIADARLKQFILLINTKLPEYIPD
jgi:EpsI family protein